VAKQLALGVLDQVPVPEGSTAAESVQETLALARTAERLGYRRYWLAEHHDTTSLASTAPEVLVGAVAGATSTIRVGSGGVLLPYYSPLKVAEVFRTLHALHPGRIDLGVGRAAGTGPVAEAALLASGGASGDRHFPEHLAELLGFLHGNLEAGLRGPNAVAGLRGPNAVVDHPWAGVRAMPQGPGSPEVWLLGSSSFSSACAASFGLPFAFAHFITPAYGPQLVAGYRGRFRPGVIAEPRVAVAVSAVCAPTDAEAERLSSGADLWRLGPEGADRAPISTPDAVAAHRWTDLEREKAAQARAKVVVGGPERAAAALGALASEFDVDELLVLTVCHDLAARRRSYELLAESVGLEPRRPA
jgi:luciferase family oxidoreductase group 1